ncbi:E3 ubiquitin-protein ligase DZIP3 [Exaiptasia diaphana]|uniref:DZIP3-like HEPN domain-containing protein n=1 Tax=Exaiptasia diaphana TaxID=2652724 RepID=A0A913YIP7_EXADI|nr:E3 ubiquitin-protein ligase DZIP3 [Exaiptasia diaphana]
MATSSGSSLRENTNYTRLCRLVIDIGSRVLRGVLDGHLHPPADLQRHLNSPGINSILKTLRSKRVLNTQQWDKLYPPAPGVPSSTTFDITLLFLLLRNTCGLTPPTTGWDAAPLPTNKSTVADLIRVKRCRNEIICHKSAAELSNTDFENHWAEIGAALTRLGGLQYGPEIQRLKIESVDPENEAYLNVLIQSWEEGEDKLLDAIRGEFNKLKIQHSAIFEEFKEEIKAEIKCEQQESFCTLPQKPSHDVVHRHDEVSMTLDEIRRLKAMICLEIERERERCGRLSRFRRPIHDLN